MPRKSGNLPAYCLHRRSGQAVVRLCGRDHYLGPYNSTESRENYDRLLAEWLANGRQPTTPVTVQSAGLLINEVLLKFIDHADLYYCRDGQRSTEVVNLKLALRPLKALYGDSFANAFGPLALKAVRQHMIDVQDLCRNEVNKRLGRIKRVFKWAVSEQRRSSFRL
jgi:hypothetical protein